MDTYEITGFRTGVEDSGVNFLDPADAFESIVNGYIYRQVLQSRKGMTQFSQTRLTGAISDGTRVMGLFEFTLRNNSTKLLAITKNFLYVYNETTDVFDQIVNPAPYAAGFSIAQDYDYVSGTGYPDKTGAARFLFTGRGMPAIFSYDGTTITVFNNVVSNPDFQDYSSPITNAWFIIYFGERLNLINPTLAASANPQTMLFSGIRNSAGNGDKFLVAGSGTIVADTTEFVNGASINGNNIILNFSRSNWTIEKTRDAFNPYFIRKIPSVLGTDAPFSPVTWYDETKSIGKTGIISTDGRESKRIDDKIPYFTQNEMDPRKIKLVYGGFDRIDGQFLFSYADVNSDTQNKVLVNNYEEDTWSINTQRLTVFGQTNLGQTLAWDDINQTKNPSWLTWDTTQDVANDIGFENEVQKTLAGDNNGFVYQINTGYSEYFSTISAMTNANPCVITTGSQAIKVGDLVVVGGVVGMEGDNETINNYDTTSGLITGPEYLVTAATTTSITIEQNTVGYSAYISGGFIQKVIDFEATLNPFNPYRSNGKMVYVSYVEFLLNTGSGSLLVDVYDNEYETPFLTDVPIIPQGTTRKTEWVSMAVNQESDFITFVLKQRSVSSQVFVKSIRIHCMEGGLTYA